MQMVAPWTFLGMHLTFFAFQLFWDCQTVRHTFAASPLVIFMIGWTALLECCTLHPNLPTWLSLSPWWDAGLEIHLWISFWLTTPFLQFWRWLLFLMPRDTGLLRELCHHASYGGWPRWIRHWWGPSSWPIQWHPVAQCAEQNHCEEHSIQSWMVLHCLWKCWCTKPCLFHHDVSVESCLCQNDSGSTLSVVSRGESGCHETIENWAAVELTDSCPWSSDFGWSCPKRHIWRQVSCGWLVSDPHEQKIQSHASGFVAKCHVDGSSVTHMKQKIQAHVSVSVASDLSFLSKELGMLLNDACQSKHNQVGWAWFCALWQICVFCISGHCIGTLANVVLHAFSWHCPIGKVHVIHFILTLWQSRDCSDWWFVLWRVLTFWIKSEQSHDTTFFSHEKCSSTLFAVESSLDSQQHKGGYFQSDGTECVWS